MRLFEAILDANHRAVAGDAKAGLRPAEFENELPIVALTCVDPRLNAFFPNVLGIPAEQFIWLRNAGNIVTGSMSSTMRSLALACAVKGGKEIAVIGHTDCQVGKTTTMQLLERFQTLGVERMLVAAGFRYARRVDPFDGGPHFVARTEEVTLIAKARRARYRGALDVTAASSAERAVVLQYLPRPPYVVSVQSEFRWSEPDGVCLPSGSSLSAPDQERICALILETPKRRASL